MTNYIIFPVGDWSGDGHSCCADFLVKSEKSLQEVREVHFKENDFIGSLCKEYDDNKINIHYLYEFLVEYMCEDDAKLFITKMVDSELELNDDDETHNIQLTFDFENNDTQHFVIYYPEEMLNVWINILNVIDPSLKLEVASEGMSQYYIKYKGYPHEPSGDINFYGYDNKNRHLETPGYGIWQDYEGEFYHS
jgi:hypothetical protein